MKHARYGRYEALELIASGGMGSVYLGRAVGPAGFERLVAIKVMHQHVAANPEFRAMFLDEARLAARIRHPNVAATLDVAEDGSFIIMELVEGASLRDVMRRRSAREQGPIGLELALRIMLDALEGLHAAHELCDRKGRPLHLVHRDVSPHNILVGVDGSSRITDFGIAFAEARISSTRQGQLKGKLPYIAPEQLEGQPADRRVDVYAAGCVLWEMLTGRRLFRADNEAALACLVMAGPTEPPSAVRPEVPEALDAACMQALAPCDARFVSAAAFGEALDAAATASGLVVARRRAVATLTEGLGLELRAGSSSGEDDLAAAAPEPPSTPPPIAASAHEHPPSTRRPATASSERGPRSATAAITHEAPSSDGLPAAVRPVAVRASSASWPSRPSQAEQVLARVAELDPSGSAAQTLASEPDQPAEPGGATATSMAAPVPLKSRRALGLGTAGVALVLLGATWAGWWVQQTATGEPTASSATSVETPRTGDVPAPSSTRSSSGPESLASGTPAPTGASASASARPLPTGHAARPAGTANHQGRISGTQPPPYPPRAPASASAPRRTSPTGTPYQPPHL